VYQAKSRKVAFIFDRKWFNKIILNLHILSGLFISPFILIYGFGVLTFNNEGLLNRLAPVKRLPEIKTKLDSIPYGKTDLATAKAVCKKLDIVGEVDFISKWKGHLSFPVNKPGLRTTININTSNDSVSVSRELMGSLRAMSYLHQMPGPHNENVRGNSIFLKFWRVLTNAVAYLLLFLTTSGVFLWLILKSERKMGLLVIILGSVTITCLIFLILKS
jgi:hypothetical protein